MKREYESEPETEKERPKKMADLGPRKIEGIGPTTRGGMPVALRSVRLLFFSSLIFYEILKLRFRLLLLGSKGQQSSKMVQENVQLVAPCR